MENIFFKIKEDFKFMTAKRDISGDFYIAKEGSISPKLHIDGKIRNNVGWSKYAEFYTISIKDLEIKKTKYFENIEPELYVEK